MIRIFRILVVLPLLATVSAFQEGSAFIEWDENRPLRWDDFQGKPEPRFAAATTSYDILKTVSKKDSHTAEVIIRAVFFKKTSWKKKQWINDDVLTHEQKHFDIVELFARKLRKSISSHGFKDGNDIESTISELYDLNDKEMDQYQDQYDEETDGSMNGDQQRAWQKKIKKELEELEAYKQSALIIKF